MTFREPEKNCSNFLTLYHSEPGFEPIRAHTMMRYIKLYIIQGHVNLWSHIANSPRIYCLRFNLTFKEKHFENYQIHYALLVKVEMEWSFFYTH